MHTCTKCGEKKHASEFHKSSRRSTGVAAWCKPCDSVRQRRAYCTPRKRARSLLNSAQKRRDTTITVEWIEERLQRGVCEVTGIPFDLNHSDSAYQNAYAPSLDRTDPSGTYTSENTKVVIFAYNAAKGELSAEDARLLIKRIAGGLP